jgi:hypothetical protein
MCIEIDACRLLKNSLYSIDVVDNTVLSSLDARAKQCPFTHHPPACQEGIGIQGSAPRSSGPARSTRIFGPEFSQEARPVLNLAVRLCRIQIPRTIFASR